MTQPAPNRRRAARGFTLIEVLISVLVFSLGILGAVGLQVRLQQATVQNGDRARASMLADEIAAVMWARQSTDIATTYNSYYTAWQQAVSAPTAAGLPSGSGTVSVDPTTKVATITITWMPTYSAASATSSVFKTTVVIP